MQIVNLCLPQRHILVFLFCFTSAVGEVRIGQLPTLEPYTPHDEIVTAVLTNYSSKTLPVKIGVNNVEYDIYFRQIVIAEEQPDRTPYMIVDMTLREYWIDKRLAYENNNLFKEAGGASVIKYIVIPNNREIWTPDTFFSNEARGQAITRNGFDQLIRVKPEGNILFSQRIRHRFYCPMNLFKYPYEDITCTIELASYAYKADQIMLKWFDKGGRMYTKQGMYIPGFTLVNVNPNPTAMIRTNTGTYCHLKVQLTFQRSSSSRHVFELFFGPAAFVVVSWIGFLLTGWKREGIALNVCLFIIYLLVISQNYANFPLARSSIVHTWISACGFLIVSELLFLTILAVVVDFLRARGSNLVSTRGRGDDSGNRLISGSGRTSGGVEKTSSEDLPRLWTLVRFAGLALFVAIFLIIVIGVIATINS